MQISQKLCRVRACSFTGTAAVWSAWAHVSCHKHEQASISSICHASMCHACFSALVNNISLLPCGTVTQLHKRRMRFQRRSTSR